MKKIIAALAILLTHFLYAQNAISTNMPKVIPASPTAQTFMRYGEIPVDYSTGVPNISIPLYTLEGRKLSVPISISYHASGIKVNDVASEVGLGWALNAGGIVTRSVNDIRDERRTGIRSYATAEELFYDLYNAEDWSYSCVCFENLENFEIYFNNSNNYEDLMSDRYFYKLPNGTSGIFTYDYPNEANIVTLPYRPYKIEKFVSGVYPTKKLDSFKITDDNGTVYTFEYYLAASATDRSEWLLKQMASADGTDVITFNYTSQPANYTVPSEYSTWMSAKTYDGNFPCNGDILTVTSSGAGMTPNFGTPVLASITSATATVTFTYASREDFTGLKRISKITVTPVSSSTPLKVIDFDEFYFGTTAANKRLGLEKIIVSAPGVTQNQQYSFTYESLALPDYHYKNPLAGFSEDLWGYYNGIASNGLVPKDFITDALDKQYFGANRDADSGTYSRACMLKAIKYPTGGRTEYVFERAYHTHLYPYRVMGNPSANIGGYVGGFRVGSITNYTDGNQIANVKTYQYGTPEVRAVDEEYFKYMLRCQERVTELGSEDWCDQVYNRYIVSSSPFLPMDIAPGLTLMYTEVTEFDGTPSSNAGKTVYIYENPLIQLPADGIRYYHPNFEDKGNYTPKMHLKTVYRKNGAGYQEVYKEEYNYSDQFATEYNTGMKVTRTVDFKRTPIPYTPLTQYDYIYSIIVKPSKAIQQASLLSNTVTFTFDPADPSNPVITSTDYTYYQQNLGVNQKTTTSSGGDVLLTSYKYPHNFPSTVPYATMITKNRLNTVLEESTYRAGSLLSTTKATYRNWGSNIIEPEFIQQQKGSAGTLEDRINFLAYDAFGNPTSIKKAGGTPICYIYSYNNRYPVAEITNAEYSTVLSVLGGASAINSFSSSYPSETVLNNTLNPLRTSSLLANAMVSTYSFKPLFGVSTVTDPKGDKFTYTYDNSGRLILVKDKDGNYISENYYNYKPQ
ncbi:hypothetical protein ACLI09_02525 [Flavobacterium sp. RHBU_24]|uniref:hypothetical protein n=1 Tax=Flavobacterium sp. RHBU_24 TaxID=3391185 RepID=UPI003984A30D